MRQAPASVLAKVPHLPETPGVYLWKDAEGKVLYKVEGTIDPLEVKRAIVGSLGRYYADN